MAQAILSIRTEEQLKKDFEAVCEEMGLTPTAAIKLFLTTVIREQRIPFEISAKPIRHTSSISDYSVRDIGD